MGIIRMGKKSEKKTADDASVKNATPQEVNAQTTKKAAQAEWDDPAVISEYEANEHGRHYRLNNGTAKSIISATPVNYYDEEEKAWKEIDNTLQDCGDTYQTKRGKCRTQISKADKGKRVKISKGKAQVSWEFLGKENAAATTFAMAKGGAEVGKASLKVENGNGRAHRAHSKATYKDVAQATDLQYSFCGNNVKENIIVREKAADYRYRFALETQGLQMRLAEDNRSIELYSENGVEFTIPSPYMYDAAGATNEEVYYELTPEQDGKHTFVVIANEEWINATDRVLPVTIDPQIVVDNGSFVTAVVQSRECESVTLAGDPNDPYDFKKPTTTVSCWGSWVTEDVSAEIKVDDMSSAQYRTFLTFNKKAFPVLDCPILDMQVLLTPVGDFGGNIELHDAATGALISMRNYNSADGRFSFDLTQHYKTACGDTFTIGLLPSGIGARFSLEENPPVLEIEYAVGGGVKPCTKEIPLCGNASGVLDVSTGNFTPEITTVSGEGLSIPCGVTHVYKPSAEDHHCGKNFRLNLDERLEKNTDSLFDANYVYTDEYGNKHGFKEHFYYLNDENRKVTVFAKDITVDADGSLWAGEHKVTKEELSDTGLKAVTQLEGVQKVEFYEQRQDEIKQLEEQVDSYKDALKDYVVIDSTTGEIVKEKVKGQENGQEKEVTLADLDDSSYDVFMKKLEHENNIPVTTSEKKQYGNLLMQEDSLTENCSEYSYIMPEAEKLRKKIVALESAYYELNKSIKPYMYELPASAILPILLFSFPIPEGGAFSGLATEDKTKISMAECFEKNLPISLDFVEMILEDTKEYAPHFADEDGNFHAEQQPKAYGLSLKAQLRQRNLYLEQLDQQKAELQEQLDAINVQKEYIKSQKSQVQKKLKQYYKEYVNKSAELALRKKCMPVSYLQGGSMIKGFNEHGDLVAIFDSYENTVMIERDKYGRISRLCDDQNNAVTFAYNSAGLLTSVTDVRGRRTNYTYGQGRLCSVSLPNGEMITLSYNGTQLSDVVSSKDIASLSYDDTCFTGVAYKSRQMQISHDEMQDGITALSSLSIAYTDTQTTVTANADVTTVETYCFGEKGGLLEYYLEEDGKVTKAERYDYEKYKRDNTTYAKNDTLYKSPLSAFEFVAGEYENTTLNDFNNPTQIVTGDKMLHYDGSCIVTRKTNVTYIYDDEQRVLEERTVITTKKPTQTETVTAVKTYAYNAQGGVVRTESYVEGEEHTSGKTVEETVYGEKGRVVKSFKYNTLDTSSKFYTENEYDESGKTTAEIDETGEHKTQIEYVDGTSIVRTKTLPNGSKFSYGHDENDTVVAITQSTEEGAENSTQVAYTCGEVTKLTSGNNIVFYTYDAKRRKTAVELNGTQYVQYAYDDKVEEDGETVNKVTATLVGGDTVESVSDLRGNVLETKYNNQPLTSAVYDAKGKRTHLLDGVTGVETATVYDELDRVKSVTVGNVTETTEYNEDGNVASKTRTENSKETTYTYAYKENAAKDLKSVSVGDVTVSPTSDCLGRSTGKTIEFAGTTIAEESITYRKVGDHATNMPSAMRFGNRIAAPVISSEDEKTQFVRLDNLRYTYDSCGNITEVRENGTLAAKYTYDALNRLVREDNKQLGKTWLYSYDNNGNILSKRELSFTLCGKEKLEELDGSVISTEREARAEKSQTGNGVTPSVINEVLYAYDGDRLLAFGSELFKYDALGNPTLYRGKTLAWANGRQLVGFDGNTFSYDGQGRRIAKNTTQFTYDSAGKLIRQTDGTDTLEFIYDNVGVVGFEYDNSTYFYRRNAQGDIIALLDNSGSVVVKYIYDAWGNHAVEVLDSTCTELSQLNPFRYRGYYYDTETGLYFLKTRYYDPEVGRFITIDDLSYLDPETINGLNLYAYCGNNPVMNVDPNGTWSLKKFWNSTVGAVIKVAIGVAVIVGLAVATICTAGAAGAVSAIVAGALVGATTAGISSVTIGLLTGQSFSEIANNFLFGVLVGGISGAISGIGAPVGVQSLFTAKSIVQSIAYQMLANATISGAEYVASTLINHENEGIAGFFVATIAGAFGGRISSDIRGAFMTTALDYITDGAHNIIKKLIGVFKK